FSFKRSTIYERYTLSLHDALPISLDGPQHRVSERLDVRAGGRRQDLPDWICAGRGNLALAEAKGSRSGGTRRRRSRPQAIKQAVDRKSTRLNSSHDQISYAVFCLK